MIRIPKVISLKPRPGQTDECLKGLTISIGFRLQNLQIMDGVISRHGPTWNPLGLTVSHTAFFPRMFSKFKVSKPHFISLSCPSTKSFIFSTFLVRSKLWIKLLGMESTYCSLRLFAFWNTFEAPCTAVWNEEDSNSGK